MRARHRWLGLWLAWVLAGAGACTSSAKEAPGDQPEAPSASDPKKRDGTAMTMTPDPQPGGSTGDFAGDCACVDKIERELALDEPDEVLGFSGEDLLSQLEGEYEIPMIWSDNCMDAPPDRLGCSQALPDFAGTATEVRIAVSSPATTVRVRECNPGGPEYCHITGMWLPVEGTLRSTDGLLDETFAEEIATQSLDAFGIGGRVATADVNGALRERVDNLTGIEWRFGVYEAEGSFEVYVLMGGTGRVVSRPAAGGRFPQGHSWGVAVDLDEARQ